MEHNNLEEVKYDFDQECKICGSKWRANEKLPCPTPELHRAKEIRQILLRGTTFQVSEEDIEIIARNFNTEFSDLQRKIEGMKLYEEDAPFEGMNDNDYKIYNQALSDVLQLFNKK